MATPRRRPRLRSPPDSRPRLLDVADLQVGDVLLCWPANPDFVQRRIQAATNSGYVHAAIVLSTVPHYAAEVGLRDGVVARRALARTALADLVRKYAHITVLRLPGLWDPSACLALRSFVARRLGRTRYRPLKVLSVEVRARSRQSQHIPLLDKFFSTPTRPRTQRTSFFCSDFVVECFMELGYLSPSAAVIYCSTDTSPGGLTVDNTFGFVAGYLAAERSYVIPSSDPYKDATRYDVMFSTSRYSRRSKRSCLQHLPRHRLI